MATSSSSNGGTTKWGQGLTQNDLMEKDTVLVLNDKDEIIGSASKKDSHVFSPKQPRAILHRAFSVFLFDKSDGRLLLQQRASTKITFPNVRAACLFGRLLASNRIRFRFLSIMTIVSHLLNCFLCVRFGPIPVALIPCMVWNRVRWTHRPM